jgi:hypothetical protein
MQTITVPSGTEYEVLDPTKQTVRFQKTVADELWTWAKANAPEGAHADDSPRSFELGNHDIIYTHLVTGYTAGDIYELTSADETALWVAMGEVYDQLEGVADAVGTGKEGASELPKVTADSSQSNAASDGTAGTPSVTPDPLAPVVETTAS